MKTKMTQHIKSQLNGRELTPSENAWDTMSQMLEGQKKEKKILHFPKVWWYVAASMVLFVFIFLGNSIKESSVENNHVTRISTVQSIKAEQPTSTNEEEAFIKNQQELHPETQLVQENTKTKEIKSKQKQSEEIIVEPEKISLAKQEEISLISYQKEEDLHSVNLELLDENTIVQTESVTPQKKKKKSNYVDSEMLLYSVENSQVISETRDNARLVIVDFNK